MEPRRPIDVGRDAEIMAKLISEGCREGARETKRIRAKLKRAEAKKLAAAGMGTQPPTPTAPETQPGS